MTAHRHGRPHRGSGIRLHPIHRGLLYAVLTLVAGSGLAWWWRADVLEVAPDGLDRALLALHGGTAMVAGLMLGSLAPQHMRFAWAARRNRFTGGLLTAFTAAMVVTAFALYYASEALRDTARLVHLGLGLVAILAVPIHIVVGRRAMRPVRELAP